MPPKYKVIKPASGVSIEVVHLAEDIAAMDQIRVLLKRIDPWNISATDTPEAREFAEQMLRSQISLVHSWHRYAQLKMRKHLAP